MRRKTIFILFCFVLSFISVAFAGDLPAQPSGVGGAGVFNKKDRVLIMAPHPDDEAIGCAGIIQQALSSGAQVKIAYLTNGEHNQLAFIVFEKRIVFRKGGFVYMGEVRRNEAIAAMKLLGLDPSNLIFLGYPDFGTFNIFSRYWQSKKPFKDIMTRISSVPYKENLSFGAPYVPENILSDVKKVLLDYKPTKIFISHPADVNGDHKAFYLFLEIALRDLRGQIPRPQVYPYLIHRVGWPLPRHYHPELNLEPPKQLTGNQINWASFDLSKEQLQKKYKAILCYKSQTESSAFYLLSFARKNELFSDYDDVELTPQASIAEKGVQFFGFSDMYTETKTGVLGNIENNSENAGKESFAVVDNSVLIRIEKKEELSRTFSLQLYIFGYSDKAPFASMPKIRIITKYNKFKIFDAMKLIRPQGVSVVVEPHAVVLKIPLEVLGNPDFILTSARSYRQDLSADTVGFRKIVISR